MQVLGLSATDDAEKRKRVLKIVDEEPSGEAGEAPAEQASAEEVVEDKHETPMFRCSKCGSLVPFLVVHRKKPQWAYCPVCGAAYRRNRPDVQPYLKEVSSYLEADKLLRALGYEAGPKAPPVPWVFEQAEKELEELGDEEKSEPRRPRRERRPKLELAEEEEDLGAETGEDIIPRPRNPCDILREVLDAYSEMLNETFIKWIMRRCEMQGIIHPAELQYYLTNLRSDRSKRKPLTWQEAAFIVQDYTAALIRNQIDSNLVVPPPLGLPQMPSPQPAPPFLPQLPQQQPGTWSLYSWGLGFPGMPPAQLGVAQQQHGMQNPVHAQQPARRLRLLDERPESSGGQARDPRVDMLQREVSSLRSELTRLVELLARQRAEGQQQAQQQQQRGGDDELRALMMSVLKKLIDKAIEEDSSRKRSQVEEQIEHLRRQVEELARILQEQGMEQYSQKLMATASQLQSDKALEYQLTLRALSTLESIAKEVLRFVDRKEPVMRLMRSIIATRRMLAGVAAGKIAEEAGEATDFAREIEEIAPDLVEEVE